MSVNGLEVVRSADSWLKVFGQENGWIEAFQSPARQDRGILVNEQLAVSCQIIADGWVEVLRS